MVTVNSGNVSTPVRVQASIDGTTLATLSDELTITTGIPHQSGFTLSPTVSNIEGWSVDGITTSVTAMLSDHFNNPVPDGTAVNFTTSGGRIGGSCSTKDGNCTVTLNSQNPRPSNGRVAVLAYAVGEESFTDLNGNGIADSSDEMKDVNVVSTDIGEAFLDYPTVPGSPYGSGTRDSNEPFIDFNGDSAYNSPDSKFNGILCSPGFCSDKKSIHVFKQFVMVFSGSEATITITNAAGVEYAANTSIDLDAGSGGSSGCKGPVSFKLNIVDRNSNVMPAGTTVELATTNGTLDNSKVTVSNTNVYPVPAMNFSIAGDGSIDATTAACSDTTASGTLTITVTTPQKIVTTKSIGVVH